MTVTIEPLPYPEEGPTDVADVVHYVRIKGGVAGLDPDELDRLTRIVDAVNAWVRTLPVADGSMGAASWPANIVEGSTMLAGRFWRRRDTPGGIYSAGDIVPIFVHHRDPDVALLLRLGDYGKPSVG